MANFWLTSQLILELFSTVCITLNLVKNREYICSVVGLKELFPHLKCK